MNRVVLVVLVLALVAGGVVLYERRTGDVAVTQVEPPPQSVSTTPVRVAPMVNSVVAYGNLVSSRAVNIASDSPGVVREILFADGQQVSSGTPLVVLDSSIAETQLQASRAQAETDTQNLRRIQSLSHQGLDSTYSLEQAQSRASASGADVKINERKLAMLTLRAPFAGRLGSRSVDAGALIAAAETIVRIEDASKLQIEFRVPSGVGLQVRQGSTVHIQIPASSDSVEGTLSFIDPTISTDTRSVLLRALVDHPGASIRPGMFVRVVLDLSTHKNALVVPVGTVTNELAGSYVFVVDEKDVAHRRDVALGLSDGNQYEVLDGLKAAEQVVAVGQFRLRDGDRVKVVPAEPAAKSAS